MDPLFLVISCSIGLLFSAYLAGRRFALSQDQEERESFDELSERDYLQQSEGRLQFIAQMMRPNDTQELSQLRKELSWAGLRKVEDLELYNAVRGALVLISFTLVAALALLGLIGEDELLFVTFFLAAAFFGPKVWLKKRIRERQEELSRSIPAALDLLVTCMEAGLNLEQAIGRVAREIQETERALADEFMMVLQELNAGLSLGIAFRKLSERVTTEDLKNLCNAIIQASTLGASLGRTLREYSASARRKRELKLEESAGKVTAKITLPLTMCLLPSAMLAMMAPAAVNIVESLF